MTELHARIGSDTLQYRTEWYCEKWSDDAVRFATKALLRKGIENQLAGYTALPTNYITKVRDVILNKPLATYTLAPRFLSIYDGITSANLRHYVGEAEETQTVHGNLLLNEGIQRLMDMTMIATVTNNQTAGNPWSNGNSFIGVGDSNTAEVATQTDLSAATNHFYKAMNATFPS